MKLWLITQTVNTGYDTYDSAVVAADSEEAARQISPEGSWDRTHYWSWALTPDQVQAKLIGEAVPGTESGVVLASFNAG